VAGVLHARNELELAFGVERRAADVVEEEERFGARRQNVVHAVVHEVVADGAVAIHDHRDAQLGADAIGARRDHGLAVAGEPEQRTEGSDTGHGLGPNGSPDDALHPGDEIRTRGDVDAGTGVCVGAWCGLRSREV
jgi:hypothetical protein